MKARKVFTGPQPFIRNHYNGTLQISELSVIKMVRIIISCAFGKEELIDHTVINKPFFICIPNKIEHNTNLCIVILQRFCFSVHRS